jgi:hypothetical protein
MYFRSGITSLLFALFFAVASPGQTAAGADQSNARPTSAMLQPALSDIQNTTLSLNISRWKAPGSIRDETQQNINSIQRDLGNTLPGLIAQADAAPAAVSPSFAVYRNIDALYDVLLRVSETADLAAPEEEANSVASSLQRLEAARSQLGDVILHTSQRNEAQIVALGAAVRSAKAALEAQKHSSSTSTVIDDGPVKTPPARRKKTEPRKPASKPAAASTPAGGSSM